MRQDKPSANATKPWMTSSHQKKKKKTTWNAGFLRIVIVLFWQCGLGSCTWRQHRESSSWDSHLGWRSLRHWPRPKAAFHVQHQHSHIWKVKASSGSDIELIQIYAVPDFHHTNSKAQNQETLWRNAIQCLHCCFYDLAIDLFIHLFILQEIWITVMQIRFIR